MSSNESKNEKGFFAKVWDVVTIVARVLLTPSGPPPPDMTRPPGPPGYPQGPPGYPQSPPGYPPNGFGDPRHPQGPPGPGHW